jgi:membrane protease YdiL (CAAX protease family)
MLLVDNGPDIMAMRPPEGPYGLKMANILPWLVMQGAFVGISEEIPFRSLFLAYLLSVLPTRLKVRRTEVSFATLITALVFSLAHVPSFWQEPLAAAIGQQVYVVGLGIFFGWLFERSGSVVAPIVAHNAGDFVEWCFLFLMRAVWS